MKNLYYLFILSFLLISCEEEVPPVTYTLTTQVTPTDAGTVNPSSGTYDEGESVTISATPSANYNFKQWTGTGSGTANPLTFKIISNTTITAEFELIDTDGDGVTDALDKCPDTPSGSTVNTDGCATSQLDSDGDGVSDDMDKCSETPDGADVNENGCSDSQLDTDSDGVTDDIDTCPDTPDGAVVDNNGCSDLQSTTFTDRDGNVYPTVIIGNHKWTTVNSRLKTYNNGTPIPYVENQSEWENLKTGAWCYVNGDPDTEEELGILYNFYAIAQLTSPDNLNSGYYIQNALKPNMDQPEWIIPGSFNFNNIYETSHYDALWKFLFENPDYPEGVTKSLATNEEDWWIFGNSKNEGPSYQPEKNNSTGFNAKPIPTRNENGSYRYSLFEPNNPIQEVRFWSGTNFNSVKGYNFVFVHDTNNSISHDGKNHRYGYPIRFSKKIN